MDGTGEIRGKFQGSGSQVTAALGGKLLGFPAWGGGKGQPSQNGHRPPQSVKKIGGRQKVHAGLDLMKKNLAKHKKGL